MTKTIDVVNWIGRTKAMRPVGLLLKKASSGKSIADMAGSFGRRVGTPITGACLSTLTGTSVKQNLTDGKIMFKTIEQYVTQFKPDFAICTMVDLALEAEACGCKLKMSDNALPSVAEHVIQSRKDLDKLTIPDPYKDGRLSVFLEATSLFNKRFALQAMAASLGPFTLSAELMGVEVIARKALKEPEFVHEVMEYSLKVIQRFNAEQVKAGAGTIAIAEPTCSLLSARVFEKLVLPYLQRCTASLPVPSMLHICGEADHLVELMCKTGVSALSLDSPTDITKIKNIVPQNIVIMGNIPPVEVLMMKKPDDVRAATLDLLKAMEGVPNFCVSSGCDLPVGTPMENVKAMIETVKEYRGA